MLLHPRWKGCASLTTKSWFAHDNIHLIYLGLARRTPTPPARSVTFQCRSQYQNIGGEKSRAVIMSMSRTARERPCRRGGLRSDWHGVVSDALGSGLLAQAGRGALCRGWPLDGGAEAQRTYSPSWSARRSPDCAAQTTGDAALPRPAAGRGRG